MLSHDVVIDGARPGGISAAPCGLRWRPGLNIALVEPGAMDYRQPGFAPVGAKGHAGLAAPQARLDTPR